VKIPESIATIPEPVVEQATDINAEMREIMGGLNDVKSY